MRENVFILRVESRPTLLTKKSLKPTPQDWEKGGVSHPPKLPTKGENFRKVPILFNIGTAGGELNKRS